MDTKEKNREGTRQRPAGQERRRDEEAPRKKKTAARAEEPVRRRRPAEESRQPRQRREQPVKEKQQPSRREQPAKEKQQPSRREQPAKEKQQPSRREQPAAEPQRTRRPAQRPDNVPISVPKGTGPRKSAPQPTEAEAASLRRQQRSQRTARQQTGEKKNALQNFISGVRGGNASADAAEKAEQRRKDRAARAEKQRKSAQRHDTPVVIYTEPQTFSRDRLLIQLFTVTAVVAAFVVGMSVFFKVKVIEVAGAETYSEYSVLQASGISEGDNLLTFSKPKAAAQIQAQLSYVDDVRIGIKLPDTVIIYIEELEVAYSIESTQGDWWLINSEGRVVEQLDAGLKENYTQVLGVRLEDPQVGNTAVAATDVPQETLSSGEPVPVTVTGEQRLSSALQILKALETNDIVGQAASVDVSSLEDVTLWYGTQYEVLLGDTARMEYKIACMNDVILQMSDYESGILDISFTNWTDQVGYTPFG